FSRRSAASSCFSAVVSAPLVPSPRSMAACFTQRVTMLVDSPSSRATPYAVLPGSLHKRTTSALYSSVNVRRFPGGDLDIFFGIILTHVDCPRNRGTVTLRILGFGEHPLPRALRRSLGPRHETGVHLTARLLVGGRIVLAFLLFLLRFLEVIDEEDELVSRDPLVALAAAPHHHRELLLERLVPFYQSPHGRQHFLDAALGEQHRQDLEDRSAQHRCIRVRRCRRHVSLLYSRRAPMQAKSR